MMLSSTQLLIIKCSLDLVLNIKKRLLGCLSNFRVIKKSTKIFINVSGVFILYFREQENEILFLILFIIFILDILALNIFEVYFIQIYSFNKYFFSTLPWSRH